MVQIRDEPTGRRGLLAILASRKPSHPAVFRPPWSVEGGEFETRCTGCGDCLAACPQGILHRSEDGKAALNFAAGGCDFCGKCVQACKQGCFEIRAGRPALAVVARVGTACLEHSGVSCRLCEDSCPTAALRARPAGGGRRVVLLDAEACTGCGACISVCPPHAIEIVARESHRPEACT